MAKPHWRVPADGIGKVLVSFWLAAPTEGIPIIGLHRTTRASHSCKAARICRGQKPGPFRAQRLAQDVKPRSVSTILCNNLLYATECHALHGGGSPVLPPLLIPRPPHSLKPWSSKKTGRPPCSRRMASISGGNHTRKYH